MRWWMMMMMMAGCAGRAGTGVNAAATAAAAAAAADQVSFGVSGGPVELVAPTSPVGLGEPVVLTLRNVGSEPWTYTRMSRPCVEGHWTHPLVTLPSGEVTSQNYSGPGRLCPTVEPTPEKFQLGVGATLEIPLSTLQPLYAGQITVFSAVAEAERNWTSGSYEVEIRLADQVLRAPFMVDVASPSDR